jgi:hypothetical protein
MAIFLYRLDFFDDVEVQTLLLDCAVVVFEVGTLLRLIGL